MARYSRELKRSHAPPQACNAPRSVAHLAGEAMSRSKSDQLQHVAFSMERPTEESGFMSGAFHVAAILRVYLNLYAGFKIGRYHDAGPGFQPGGFVGSCSRLALDGRIGFDHG